MLSQVIRITWQYSTPDDSIVLPVHEAGDSCTICAGCDRGFRNGPARVAQFVFCRVRFASGPRGDILKTAMENDYRGTLIGR